jgi:excisionase family DNA binding protein
MNDAVFYTTAEVADLLRCTRDKVYDMVRDKQIPHVQMRGTWLFPVKDIHDWLVSKKVQQIKAER